MIDLKAITISDIDAPIIVHSVKGRKFDMIDRKTYGLALCVSGQITYIMNGKEFINNKNNAVILPQGGTYTVLHNKDGIFPIINFKCEGLSCDEITVIPLKNPQQIISTFEEIKNLDLKNKRLKFFGGFYKILDQITSQNTRKDSRLLPAIAFINENLNNPSLSNKELAAQLKISEVYLRKLFAAEYGISPKQFILNKRIQTACRLLVETPLSISSVAEKCGFASPYHFCRAFKLKVGITPSEYAEQNKFYQI